MYNIISRLLVFKDIKFDSVLNKIAETYKKMDLHKDISEIEKNDCIEELNNEINKIITLANQYGFDKNLWKHYIAYLLAMSENPLSLLCEKRGKQEGSINLFALEDAKLLRRLFHFDFKYLEETLGIGTFSILTHYEANTVKEDFQIHTNISDIIRQLTIDLDNSSNEEEFLTVLLNFYKDYGVGNFGLNKAFRIKVKQDDIELIPTTNTENVTLSQIIGYDIQKKKLIENTEAFINGYKANNVLLYGDSGTGKSTSVKAILNEYYDKGLRIIELYKHQFEKLPDIIAMIKNRNYKFIIYMDDLSFEEFEVEYKYLKAVIEGGLEVKPDNVLIYATSNRRHIIRETWSDRSDISKDELHKSDTMQEKLSLVARFGITIHFPSPNQKEYFEIVKGIAKNIPEIRLSEEDLCKKAHIWEMNHGGPSGRCAKQFINYLLGQH